MLEVDLRLDRSGFSLRIQERFQEQTTGVFGPSGAGKTTLLHLLAGLLRPDAGRIVLDDRVLFDSRRSINVPAHRRQLGVVFQDHRLFPHLSVRGNLAFGPAQRRRAGVVQLDDVVELLELRPLLDRRPRHLSGGERQRVSLGRALLTSPRILLLDEPLAALDQRLKRQILPFLDRIQSSLKIPMIYISHDLGEILQLTSRLVLVQEGAVVASGPYDELAQNPEALSRLLPSDLLNVLTASVAEHRPESGCSIFQLETPGRTEPIRLAGPLLDLPPGRRLKIAIRAEEIALSLNRLSLVSFQNQVPGLVLRQNHYRGTTVMSVDIGVPILVEVTAAARIHLGLEAGTSVLCLMKANALRVLSEL